MLSSLVLTVLPVLTYLTVHQAKLAELQDLVMRLVAERNDWYNRYAGAGAGAGSVNPDLLPVGEDHAHPEHRAHTHSTHNAFSGAGKHSQKYYMLYVSMTALLSSAFARCNQFLHTHIGL